MLRKLGGVLVQATCVQPLQGATHLLVPARAARRAQFFVQGLAEAVQAAPSAWIDQLPRVSEPTGWTSSDAR